MKIYDRDIRKALFKWFVGVKEFVDDPFCVMVNELDVCMGCARIDIAIINGCMHGFEIKSERDNLERLPKQIEFYNQVFDSVTIVVSEGYLNRARKIIPEWWGVLCVKEKEDAAYVRVMRNPERNLSSCAVRVAQLLWKDEMIELLSFHNIKKGVKSKTRFELSNMAEKNIDPRDISLFVRNKLKHRTSWKALPLRQIGDGLRI